MPQGRHRQAPPLHRMLAPAALAVTALACAGGAWLTGDESWPPALATGAALAAAAGAVLLRRWDREAGRRLGEAQAERRGLEWRVEERYAELEGELEEVRESRGALQGALRAQREAFERLRTEHAALLRRYAHAETDRASALEGRRQLALAAAEPARALPPGRPAALSAEAFRRANAALDRLGAAGGDQAAGERGRGFDYFAAGAPPAPSGAEAPSGPAAPSGAPRPRRAAPVIELAERGEAAGPARDRRIS
ncbi:hypothetical protein WDH52_15535 [Streptomyces sp. TRM70308]|uniref:hypothetical protein n=1 Tax=Streptomyces sp. TRM70308 TaxID=3131932 RepID=UPI003CFE4333